MKKIGGEIMATGIVDHMGSGVPFKLCTKNVAPVVTNVGNRVATIIAIRFGHGRSAK